jgi:tripartite-type tricarboxylate transporter receptor subunit TctC
MRAGDEQRADPPQAALPENRKRRDSMNKKFCAVLLGCTGLLLATQQLARAQEDPFYQDKTIKVIVGFTSGGFYDRWSRLLARYVPKYLPGSPEMIVQNMPAPAG